MSSGLLPLFREIEKRGGPLRMERENDGTWCVEAFGLWWSVEPMSQAGEWCVVGALLESLRRDSIFASLEMPADDWMLATSVHGGIAHSASVVSTVAEAWLAAHPEGAADV